MSYSPRTAAEAALLEGFVQTDEMRAADEAVRNSTPETEPENWTKTTNYGWIYTGPLAKKTTATQKATYMNSHMGGPAHDARRQYKTGAWGWLHGGDLLEQAAPGEGFGFGNFTQESWDRLRAAGMRGHPLIDTSPHDHDEILAQYKMEGYNPFLDHGMWDRGAQKGSVADVLYGLTKDNVKLRMPVWTAIRGLKGNLGETQMTSQLWNQYGLNEILGDYGEKTGGGMSQVDWIKNKGGMMSGLNNKLPQIQINPNNAQASSQGRGERRGVWGSGYSDGGYSLFGEENQAMRRAIGEQLEKKLLG